MAPRRETRINGPYAHGARWRVVVVTAGGERAPRTRSYATREEAQKVIDESRQLAGNSISVKDAIEQFEGWLKSTGVKAVTTQTARERLDRALGDHQGQPVTSIVARGEAIYQKLRTMKIPDTEKNYAVATHRNTLSVLKRFGGWLVRQGLTRRNPFVDVAPQGKPKRGKPQLRVDESRKLLEVCIRRLSDGDPEAVQPALALLMGLRASEIANLECRDVDDNGRLLWVAQVEHKTDYSKRIVEVPRVLQATLSAMAKDDRGEAKPGRLIEGATRFTVYGEVKRLAKIAGVPWVSPHGLRGTHATLATSMGATGELVMAALGQASVEVGDRHYTNPTVKAGAQARKVSELLLAASGDSRCGE